MVEPALVVTLLQAEDKEVPDKNVLFARNRNEVVEFGPRLNFAIFFLESDDTTALHFPVY